MCVETSKLTSKLKKKKRTHEQPNESKKKEKNFMMIVLCVELLTDGRLANSICTFFIVCSF